MQLVGTQMLALGTACGAISYRSLRTGKFDQGWLALAVELTLMTTLLAGGRWALRQGRRHRAPVLPGLGGLPQDTPLVLLLRSFVDDEGLASIQHGSVRDGPWHAATETEEQQLGQAVEPFGKMIALGRPSDHLPQVGAARHYSSDEEWQAQVLAGLDRAVLVLLVCGPGRSLRWEVEQVVARCRPERLVLLGVRNAVQYESFRLAMQDVFPKGLPPTSEGSESWKNRLDGPETYVREAVWFDADWTPHLAPLGSDEDPEIDAFRLISARAWVRTAFPLAIRTVYRRAGVNPPGLPPGRLPRPRAVKAAVPLIALAWGALLTTGRHPRGSEVLTVLLFMALPIAALLYGTWRGGMFTSKTLALLCGLGPLVFAVMSLFVTLALHVSFGVDQPSARIPIGIALVTGALLLSRQDVHDWQASRAYRVPPRSETDSGGPAT
ncbi:hypothetical protein ACVB8X_29725 [Streptomyces sp. NRAIS4]